MKIALLGYGKMGHEVEKSALAKGHTIHLILNDENDWHTKGHLLKNCDVAIEFSMPAYAFSNISKCIETGIPVVVGTTGWYEKFNEVSDFCNKHNGSLFYASNFSIGVNIFFEINRKLSSLLGTTEEYKPSMTEIHHIQKLDAPSGTAITLAKDIVATNKNIHSYANGIVGNGLLTINSIREGEVTGTHEIKWTSAVDEIKITHQAFNRKGFANGAVLAAEWLLGRKGIFTMKDMLAQ